MKTFITTFTSITIHTATLIIVMSM